MISAEDEFVIYDTCSLESGMSSVTLFNSIDGSLARSATEICESELLSRLLATTPFRSLLLKKIGLTEQARIKTELREPFVLLPSARPGDIDMLMADPGTPNEAVAFECKRVKVKVSAGKPDQTNKIKQLHKAQSQLAGLAQMKFHRTYMLLLIAVDGQESDGANAAFRGISSETESAIYGAVKKLHFPETVGVIVADCTQALRKPLESAGALAVAVRREAVRVEQSQWTTQSVENVLGSS